MVITSLDNDKIKNICKLNKKKYRDSMGLYLIEGEHLVLEASKYDVIDDQGVFHTRHINDVKDLVDCFDSMLDDYIFDIDLHSILLS